VISSRDSHIAALATMGALAVVATGIMMGPDRLPSVGLPDIDPFTPTASHSQSSEPPRHDAAQPAAPTRTPATPAPSRHAPRPCELIVDLGCLPRMRMVLPQDTSAPTAMPSAAAPTPDAIPSAPVRPSIPSGEPTTAGPSGEPTDTGAPTANPTPSPEETPTATPSTPEPTESPTPDPGADDPSRTEPSEPPSPTPSATPSQDPSAGP
jgi:hypothetical protein